MLAGENYRILISLLAKNTLLVYLLLLGFTVLVVPPALISEVCTQLKLRPVLQFPTSAFLTFF